ncbi:GtrA family protein [Candidatus Falkowbacteria bacterium]|nr:GtrA family protein [Candidatus Falkowbacteria bacterium]
MLAILNKNETLRQFIKFCVVGFGNTIIDYGVYLFFSRLIDLYYLYANILAILVAMTFSFFVNKYWTFGNFEKEIKIQYAKFFLIGIVYFILYNAIFYLCVNNLLIYDLLAKIIAIAIGLFWNFIANKYWTFRKNV